MKEKMRYTNMYAENKKSCYVPVKVEITVFPFEDIISTSGSKPPVALKTTAKKQTMMDVIDSPWSVEPE